MHFLRATITAWMLGKDRIKRRNKYLIKQVAGTWEPSILVNDPCPFPLNTSGYEHFRDKDHCGMRCFTVSNTLLLSPITTATSQKNITPRGITTNKPSHFLIFWAFETWVLATEFQPEHNQMLTQFLVNGLFGCCLRHPWTHSTRIQGTDRERSLPVSWTEALAGARSV